VNRLNGKLSGGRIRPRSFFEPPRAEDLPTVSLQMKGRKFDPGMVIGTARRCVFGLPSVIVCSPLRDGKPFPTTFWLTCPHLVKLCGALESEGAVAELERRRMERPDLWTEYNLFHARLRLLLVQPAAARFLRKYRRGVWDTLRRGGAGGIDYLSRARGGAKCLHLQAASWLALGFHPAGEFLHKALVPLHCAAPAASGCVRRC